MYRSVAQKAWARMARVWNRKLFAPPVRMIASQTTALIPISTCEVSAGMALREPP